MSFFSKISLRNMLVVPYVVLVLVLAAINVSLSRNSEREAIDTWSSQLLVETIERIRQAIERHVSGSAAVLEVAFPEEVAAPANIEGAMDALRTRFWLATSVHRDPNNYAYYGDLQGHFFGLMRLSEAQAELRLRLQGEGPRSIHHFEGFQGELGPAHREERIFEPRQRPWFLAAQSSPLHTWTAIYIDFKTNDLVVTRARRVNDAEGELAGVVATDLSLRKINRFLRKLSLSENGVAMVVEEDGKLVGVSRGPHLTETAGEARQRLNASDSPEPLVAATYDAVKNLIGENDHEPKTAVFEGPDGNLVQVGYVRLEDDAGLNWLAMVAVPRHDFQQEVEDNVRMNVYLAVVATVCVVLLGLLVLSAIANELRRLASAAQRFGEGDLSVPLATEREDEIGQLSKSFSAMATRLLTDNLTGLLNREAILRRIEDRILQQRRRADDRPFVVLFIDLNKFKQINDRFGHDIGDLVLIEFAERIRASVREQDSVARYAGDEFVVLVDSLEFANDAEALRVKLERVLLVPAQTLRDVPDAPAAGASIGIAMYPQDGLDVETLLRAADTDMYQRKKQF